MVFSSFIFLFWFLPLFLAVYYAAPRTRRNLVLTIASYLFYGWWRPEYVLLMLASTVIDYTASLRMGPPGSGRPRRRWLWLSVVTNLGLLGYFKYTTMLLETVNAVRASWGGEPLPIEQILLPVGISFYTFQSMSYTIDVYRGAVKPIRSFLDLACFVSMFPQLVAGPIVRYRQIQRQMHGREHTWSKLSGGVFLLMIGVAKKVLIADNAAVLADGAFATAAPGLLASWIGVASFAVQIYFDFSGYSDMAVGLGRMIGFELPKNFNSPYKGASFTEVWRRWHMSLTGWMRDYVYRSLGGQKKGYAAGLRNVFLTMVICGLWHGAAWTFVLWGAIHGAILVAERMSGKSSLYPMLPRPLQRLATYAILLATFVLFRADSFASMTDYLGGMLGAHGAGRFYVPELGAVHAYFAAIAGTVICHTAPDSWAIVQRFRPLTMLGVLALFLFTLGHLLTRSYTPFLYFQF